MPDLSTTDRVADLFAAIDQAGYFPAVVRASVTAALAGERVVAFLSHHEPTIDHDQVRRHMTVAVVTPSRLLLNHTDDHSGDDLLPQPYAATTTEAIPLRRLRSVVVNRMVANPEKYVGELEVPTTEAVLTLNWGGVNRIDMEPANCGDPDCTADHGYTGVFAGEDFSLRVSAAADGQVAVDNLLTFADCVTALTAGDQ
ncbi:MAG TPA: DUF5998 family protein [Marmoricola sp.]|nr:DUF5998 family protein [Marmoricola sp.]HNJ79183.1 DUF5998 family protein [Marmoricola sp.]HNO40311.1 DUF5998 family protein [Marmoricola sp.]